MTDQATAATRRRPLPLLLYLASSATSLFGNASIAIVLPWLVLTRTGDPALTGLVAAASALPSAVSGFVGGHLADRFGRRTICVISDVGSALSVAALILVDATVGLNVVWFVVLGILGALFDIPGMSARQAMMGNVAEESGTPLDRIAAAESVLLGLSFLAGPAAAGILLATLPTISVVWVTAACSALAALLIALMPLPPTVFSPEETSEHASPLAGLRIIRRNPALFAMLVISVASVIFVAPLLSVVLPAHFQLTNQPQELGFSLSAFAVGSLIGSGLYGVALSKHRHAAWMLAQFLYGAGGILIASLAGFWPIAIGMAVAGIGSGLEQPVVQVLLTERVPDAVRGRVFGLYTSVSTLATPLGLVMFAALLAAANLQVAAIVVGAGFLMLSLYALFQPDLRRALAPHPDEAADSTEPDGSAP